MLARMEMRRLKRTRIGPRGMVEGDPCCGGQGSKNDDEKLAGWDEST